MIKRFFKKLGDSTINETRIQPKKHWVNLEQFSPFSLEVVDVLLEAGHESYLVGGCIRDAQLNKVPKDFDVATSATPEQVKALFRRSRIIGRRFKIVHVMNGREVIEVTTFRGSHTDASSAKSSQNQQGVLVRDNVFGSIQEDALRRDFTCNSLYFDIDSEEVIDFTGGHQDLKKKILRTIGNPEQRFKEDPVRMMRAMRFQAKLDLKLDKKSDQQLYSQAHMINEVSPARLYDEVVKLLLHEEASKAFNLMQKTGLFAELFPTTAYLIKKNAGYKKMFAQAMKGTEGRLRQSKTVSSFYLYAVLLWPAVEREFLKEKNKKQTVAQAMDKAGAMIIDEQCQRISISKHHAQSTRDTWNLQLQLVKRQPENVDQILGHYRFRGAYDFLLLREQSGEVLNNSGKWWTEYQNANPSKRTISSQNFKSRNNRKSDDKPRRGRSRRRTND